MNSGAYLGWIASHSQVKRRPVRCTGSASHSSVNPEVGAGKLIAHMAAPTAPHSAHFSRNFDNLAPPTHYGHQNLALVHDPPGVGLKLQL